MAIEATWVTPAIIARDATISVSAFAAVDADGGELPLDGLDGRSWTAKPTPLGFLSQRPTAVAAPEPDGLRLSVGSGFEGRSVAVIVSARPAGSDTVTLMPVAVTERYLDESGGELGDRIRLDGLGGGVAAVEIVATVPSFPTVDPRRTESIIADLTTVQLATLAPGQSIRSPDEYWLELDVDDHTALRPVLEAAPFEVVSLVTRNEQLDALTSDPPAVAALGAMSVGFVAATLFAAVGFAVSASISARERADEFATLRALGLSQRQLGRWLAAEQVIVATMSLLVGLSIGLALSALLLPRISLTQRGEEVFPPVAVAYPWSSIGVLLAIVASVTAAVVAGVFAQVVRHDRGRSRIGEVE